MWPFLNKNLTRAFHKYVKQGTLSDAPQGYPILTFINYIKRFSCIVLSHRYNLKSNWSWLIHWALLPTLDDSGLELTATKYVAQKPYSVKFTFASRLRNTMGKTIQTTKLGASNQKMWEREHGWKLILWNTAAVSKQFVKTKTLWKTFFSKPICYWANSSNHIIQEKKVSLKFIFQVIQTLQ